MKYAKTIYAMTLTILPILLPVIAAAQVGENGTLAAQVPFEYMVANKVFPAGQCVVQSFGTNTLMIRNVAAKISMFSPAMPAQAKKTPGAYALVFHRYGDRYFLAGIRQAGRTSYRLPENKAEAELRAHNGPATEEVVLAALQQ